MIDLETAWMRINCYSPSLGATDIEIHIREANRRQANLKPNPVFSVDGQNLGVDPSIDAEAPQNTYAVSQLLEMGGKQKARKEYAASQTEIAFWDLQITRQNLRYELIVAFVNVSMAQAKWKIAIERQHIAEKILDATVVQVEAGKISPIQERKAKLSLKSAQISVREAFAEFIQAKKKLSVMWGSACPDFDTVAFELTDYQIIPDFCDISGGILKTPDFIKAQTQIFSAMRNVKVQQSIGVPDVTVTVGYRTYSDSDQRGWVVGAALPIPLCNKNQGNIAKANFEVTQAQYQMDEVARSLQGKIEVVYEKLIAAFDETEIMKTGVLIEATETFHLTEIGYEKGKLQYLDLLDAQKILFEMQEKYIEILANYHLNKAELDRLTGRYNNI